ncbi:MAG: DUF4424 domain-containing protein [Armatimonadetes bacterium]|nr:DUF4424 domain-containing protein [Armatimonadota bacterium]NIM24642.1 DUF4424 domain-containing protein [Armatimonadota bacterium]NIM68521.1 DUF4424 domain-containing protein [Armatimonadota bacterium]NIM76903.1 DUF4424 domain-containing protein [Armatimonadota bacterium]NIN06715.1 DUF4424 domain-containing protein [Armatimonadota bacterium]
MKTICRVFANNSLVLFLILVSVLATAVSAPPLLADGEPLAWVGDSLQPVDNDSIRMVWERVIITLSPMSAEVGADFIFRNDGETCEQVMGFPAHRFGRSPMRDFEAWVEGNKVEVQRQTEAFAEHLYYWKVAFPKGSQRRVRVRYRTQRDLSMPSPSLYKDTFIYVLRTGAHWKGSIGHAEIDVNLVDMEPDQVISLEPAGFERTPSGYRLVLENFEPDEDVRITFNPSGLKVVYRDPLGRDREYHGHPPLVRGKTALISSKTFYYGRVCKPEWDAAAGTFTVKRGPLTIRCQVGSRKAFLGEREITLSAAPEAKGDEVMLPAEITEPLGINVLFKPHTKELFLRGNHLNWDIHMDPPEYQSFHLAPRRYLAIEYRADLRTLDREIAAASSPAAKYDALFKRGDIYYYQGDWEKAEKAYASAHEWKAKTDVTVPDWARWWQGKSLRWLRHREEALEVFANLAIAGCRDNAMIHETLVTLAALEATYSVGKYARHGWRPTDDDRQLALRAARAAERFAAKELGTQLRVEMIKQMIMLGEHEEAETVMERLLASGDKNDDEFLAALKPLYNDWVFRGKGRTLGYSLVKNLQGTPAEERFLYRLAKAEKADGRLQESLELHERLVASFPASQGLGRYLGDIASLTKRMHGEEAFEEKCWSLIQQYPISAAGYLDYACKGEEQLRWIVENVPRPSRVVLMRLADIEYWRGDYASALDLCKASGIGGDLRTALPKWATLLSAFCSMQLGDMEKADKILDYYFPSLFSRTGDELLEKGPDCETAYIELSQIFSVSEQEREILRRGLEKYPHSARLHHTLGRSFLREQRRLSQEKDAKRAILLKAVEKLAIAVELAPDNNDYRTDLSNANAELARL